MFFKIQKKTLVSRPLKAKKTSQEASRGQKVFFYYYYFPGSIKLYILWEILAGELPIIAISTKVCYQDALYLPF